MGFGLVNLLTMLEVTGRTGTKFNLKALRLIHRISGVCFIILFLVLSYYCVAIMRASGQELGPRASLHALLSVAAAVVLFLKLSFARIYRKYFTSVAVLGLTLFLMTASTTALSAGYYFAMKIGKAPPPIVKPEAGTEEKGAVIFARNCADCHYADKTETNIGPGFRGLFKRKSLPVSGRPVTDANVIKQLGTPVESMPSFPDMSEEELKALVGYLRTL